LLDWRLTLGGDGEAGALFLPSAAPEVYDPCMRQRSIVSWLLAGGAALALAGCASGHDAADKELAELRTTVTKLRAEQTLLSERVEALEGGRRAAGGPAPGAGSSDRPDLEVVHVDPDPGDAADADGPRPVIRAQGRAASIEDAARDKPQGPERDFELAMDLYKQHKTEKALAAFSTYLTRYPDHPNAEQVTFLRAEAYGAKGDQRRAVAEYEGLVAKWPGGARAPEALLRAAQSYQRLGDKNASDEAKKRLAASYPASDAAKKLALAPSK
jgi:TolA-binding protein